jgi:hypothetical protein
MSRQGLGMSLLFVLPALLLAAMARAQAPAAPIPADEIIARFEIGIDGDAVYLPVNVGNTTCLFLLDTGASYTIFDLTLLSTPPTGSLRERAPTGQFSTPRFDTPTATLGSFNLQDSVPFVAGVDLAPIREQCGDEVYGIIGMDFLANHVVRFDFDRGECVFLKRSSAAAGEKVVLRFARSKIPYIVANLAQPSPERFFIDTGASAWTDDGDLTKLVAKNLLDAGKARDIGRITLHDLSGASTLRRLQCDAIVIGDITVPNPIFATGDRANRLGMPFLARFVVTFDFPQGHMYLQGRKSFRPLGKFNGSGLWIVRREGKTVVDSVRGGSAAESAGLRAGDEILRLGEYDALQARLYRLYALLSQEATTIDVIALRDGKKFGASLLLK